MGQRNIKLCQTRGVTFKNLKVNEDRLIATTRWRTRKRGSSHPPLPLLHLRWEGAFPSQRAPFQGFKDHSNPSPPTTSIFIQLLPVGQRSLVGCSPWGREESDTTERLHFSTFHFHALEKEMAIHSSVLAWRIPGTGEPGGLPSLGSHRVRHD